MKWLFVGLGTALAASLVIGGTFAVCRKRPKKDNEDIDGDVVKRYRTDAPKEIKSTEIISFHCEISLIAACDVDDLGHRVYTLDADLKDGEVLVKYDWYERNGERDNAVYQTDVSFMARLQKIVSEYDFAQQNGYYHSVSGLPGMYGGSLHIVYESNERIDIYDNQSGILPYEAEKALICLFGAATKLENK